MGSDDEMRFSDEKLHQLHKDFTEHRERTDQRFESLIGMQEKNAESIGLLVAETRGIVQLHRDLQGATRIGMNVQRFGVWIIKWPLIGTGLYAAYSWVIEHLPT